MTELKDGWSYKRLDELGAIARGKSKHRPRNDPCLYGGKYPFIQTGDVKNADLYISKYSQTYNEKGLAQSKLWEPDTLCITIAANIAETALLKINACFPDSIVGFVANKEEADVKFVKYYIDTIKLQMQNISKGTTQDNLSLDKLLLFKFLVPSVGTQRKIASILSNYDDLIENNTRRIEILEQIAKLVYEEWFIKFRFPGHEKVKIVPSELGEIPEGWRIDKLEKIANVNELSLKKGEEPQEINYVDISSVTTGKIDETKFIAYSDAPSRARRIVKHGDIIWSTVRPNRKSFALILNPLPNLIVSTGFAVITAKSIPYTYLYHILTADDFVGYLTNNATGAAYPAVNADDFKNANILVPTDDLLDQFNKIVSNLFNLKHNLLDKNQNLRKTRDLLLPKLISGEIDVSDLDIRIKNECQERNFNFEEPQDEKGLRLKVV
ncbi:restriction endonuclease subunit S [Methanosarcina sp.]|uniref:restriction endonuclease subunit S n=1 Tax=Methanosarcina sp. TaxID=2213 RepID=UPI002988CB17|nr:restriction endonuclease subunit S [Methanosarcina sp.]MDW5551094.1 restriction endonuclease subunit S [Methanosarcina sp.]MDW5554948.1 restriction endonuclease subunit S [Methanosarcina sp.]MDW5561448.1 restriction endonuclease subunit S [Methanosarcina sp.]